MQITISSKQIKELSSDTGRITQALDNKKNIYYAKIISIQKSQQYGYDECIKFNTQILQDLQDFIFKQNILQIKTRLFNQKFIVFITQPYDCRLHQSIEKEPFDQKLILSIFDQIVKAVYSLIMNGYWHRNIRAEHFVRCKNIWKLQSLVLNEDYKKANGFNSQYLWSSKHQPPQFITGKSYEDNQYNQMTVWNLGCILLQMIIGNHKLSNKTIIDKFKDKPFTFEAIGIKADRINKLSTGLKERLSSMLHYNPAQRMKLQDLFENKNISLAVAKHALQNKKLIPPSKIMMGKSSKNSRLNFQSTIVLQDIAKNIEKKQKQKQGKYSTSKINSLIDGEDFLEELQAISSKIPAKLQIAKDKVKNFSIFEVEQLSSYSLEDIMVKNNLIRKSLQIYKSYYDQSELLILAVQNVEKVEFTALKDQFQIKQIKLLIKYAVVFASLLNLQVLAESFNHNRNIYHLDGDQFSIFQNSSQYSTFQNVINYKITERRKDLDDLRQKITFSKVKYKTKEDNICQLLQKDYKNTNFSDIKVAYRHIMKYAYDSISEQYNTHKKTQQGEELARRAMFITYCLTVDKLYIKEDIPDNFKYYFQWASIPASNYVPLNDFKNYILQAPKQILIQNSRYILKKYYNF